MAPFLLNALVLAVASTAIVALMNRNWPHRYPCAALMLWCGVVLSVPVALVGSLVMFATDEHLPSRDYTGVSALAATGTLLTICVIVRVGRPLLAAQRRSARTRARHRSLLALFASCHPRINRVFLVPDDRGFAYSVPSLLSGDVVISRGFANGATKAGVDAVVAHERSHILGRHHLLLQVAIAAAEATPGTALTALPERVSTLLEMSADCWASRRSDRSAIISAILTLAEMECPTGALPAGERDVVVRLKFLAGDSYRCCSSGTSTLILSAASMVLAVPFAAALSGPNLDLCFLLQER